MYPDQQPPRPNEYPVDYLNQIAPQTGRRGSGPNLKFIVLILAGLAVIAIGLMLAMSLSAKPNNDQRLAARLNHTATIVSDSHKNIKSNHLRGLNSSLGIILTNANRDLASHLSASGVDPKKLSARASAPEAAEAEKLTAMLEDARLNATFDRTYARELAYRLETINTYLKTAHENSSSDSYRQFLAETSGNIGPIYQQIAEFTENAG